MSKTDKEVLSIQLAEPTDAEGYPFHEDQNNITSMKNLTEEANHSIPLIAHTIGEQHLASPQKSVTTSSKETGISGFSVTPPQRHTVTEDAQGTDTSENNANMLSAGGTGISGYVTNPSSMNTVTLGDFFVPTPSTSTVTFDGFTVCTPSKTTIRSGHSSPISERTGWANIPFSSVNNTNLTSNHSRAEASPFQVQTPPQKKEVYYWGETFAHFPEAQYYTIDGTPVPSTNTSAINEVDILSQARNSGGDTRFPFSVESSALEWNKYNPDRYSMQQGFEVKPPPPSTNTYEPQTHLQPQQLKPPIHVAVETKNGTRTITLPTVPPFLPPDSSMEDFSSLMKHKFFRRQLRLWSMFGYPDPNNKHWVMARQWVLQEKQPPRLQEDLKIDPDDLEQEVPIILEPEQARELNRVWRQQNRPHGNWTFIGPRNVGGRINSLAVAPNDPLHILAGASSGGVWESRDGGKSWRSLFDSQPTQAVGAVAFGSTASIMYVGTGDPVQTRYEGRGLFRSTDGGATWVQMRNNNLPGSREIEPNTQINGIAINPNNDDEVYISTDSGAAFSLDGGDNWRELPDSPVPTWDIEWESAPAPHFSSLWITRQGNSGDPLLVNYTRVETRGAIQLRPTMLVTPPRLPDAINRDGSRITWYANKGRFAIHPTSPNIMVACYGTRRTSRNLHRGTSSSSESVLVFRSQDSGNNWSKIAEIGAGQAVSYNLALGIDPNDPQGNTIFVGAQSLHEITKQGGKYTFTRGWTLNERGHPNWRSAIGTDRRLHHITGYPINLHSDFHDIVYIPKFQGHSSGLMYLATDGGVYTSTDKGKSWRSRSLGLGTTQFYNIGTSKSGSTLVGGATQDNGCLRTLGGLTFQDISGGDGGTFTIAPKEHTQIVFDTDANILDITFDAGIHRHSILDEDGLMQAQTGWYDWPTKISQKNPLLIYTAIDGIFRSEDDGKNWVQISTDMTYISPGRTLGNFSKRTVDPTLQTVRGGIFPPAPFDPASIDNRPDIAVRLMDLAISEDGNVVVASAEGGRRLYKGQRQANGNWEWQLIILPDRSGGQIVRPDVASIELVPEERDVGGRTQLVHDIYVLTQNQVTESGWLRSSHVFYIPEGATQPNDIIDLTNRPRRSPLAIPNAEIAFDLVADPWDSKILYLATESGVYVCHRAEAAWRTLGGYLPKAPCFHLEIDPVAGLLRVGTYGRGIWEIPIKPGMEAPMTMLYLRHHLCDLGRGSHSSHSRLRDPSRPIPTYQLFQNIPTLKYLYWWESPDIKVDAGISDKREISREGGGWETEDVAIQRIIDNQPNARKNIVTSLDGVTFDTELLHDQISTQISYHNDVYVQVHNRGPKSLDYVIVRAFWSESTIGFAPVPADFWSHFDTITGTVGTFQPIGEALIIKRLDPSTPKVLRFHWQLSSQAQRLGMILIVASTMKRKWEHTLEPQFVPAAKKPTVFDPFGPEDPLPPLPNVTDGTVAIIPDIYTFRETLLHRMVRNHRQVALNNVRVVEAKRSKTQFIEQSVVFVNHTNKEQDFDIVLEPAELYNAIRFLFLFPPSWNQSTTTLHGWGKILGHAHFLHNIPWVERPRLSRIKLKGSARDFATLRIILPTSSLFSKKGECISLPNQEKEVCMQLHGLEGVEVYKFSLMMHQSDTHELVGGCTFEIRVQ